MPAQESHQADINPTKERPGPAKQEPASGGKEWARIRRGGP